MEHMPVDGAPDMRGALAHVGPGAALPHDVLALPQLSWAERLGTSVARHGDVTSHVARAGAAIAGGCELQPAVLAGTITTALQSKATSDAAALLAHCTVLRQSEALTFADSQLLAAWDASLASCKWVVPRAQAEHWGTPGTANDVVPWPSFAAACVARQLVAQPPAPLFAARLLALVHSQARADLHDAPSHAVGSCRILYGMTGGLASLRHGERRLGSARAGIPLAGLQAYAFVASAEVLLRASTSAASAHGMAHQGQDIAAATGLQPPVVSREDVHAMVAGLVQAGRPLAAVYVGITAVGRAGLGILAGTIDVLEQAAVAGSCADDDAALAVLAGGQRGGVEPAVLGAALCERGPGMVSVSTLRTALAAAASKGFAPAFTSASTGGPVSLPDWSSAPGLAGDAGSDSSICCASSATAWTGAVV